MNYYKWIFFICFVSVGCTEIEKADPPSLDNGQKQIIEKFSNELVGSINEFDFSVIKQSWSNELFKERVAASLTKTQKSVLVHEFEKDLRRIIKIGNVDIINQVNQNNGKAALLRLEHFSSYSELTVLLIFKARFDLIKYKIELVGDSPVITDFYSFKDNLWYSQKMVNALRVNSKYDAFSKHRHQANRALNVYEDLLIDGDSMGALLALYDVPIEYQIGNWLSFKKLNLASQINDSIYYEVLNEEHINNQSLYIKYLWQLQLQDSTNIPAINEAILKELGESEELDSLLQLGYVWN